MHISACYRWIQRGVRGAKLEAIRVGGSTYTSMEAIQRFADRLGAPGAPVAATRQATTRTRQKQIDQASSRLRDALGLQEANKAAAAGGDQLQVGDRAVPRQ